MAKTITLKYEAQCADCGAPLIPGDRARYYGRGKVYGVDCHTKAESAERNFERPQGSGSPRALSHDELENWPEGRIASHYDPGGAYSPDGTYLGHGRPRCEDAPCCGCCP
jgi:hypothetical protein